MLQPSQQTTSFSVFPSVKLKIVTQFLKGRNFPLSVWVVFHFSQRTNCCCVLKPNFDHFYPKFSEDWFTFCLIQLFTNDKLPNQEPAFLLYTSVSIINFFLSWFSIYVQYVSVPPTVSLDIGKALNLNDLEEGDDVYFECSISANPPPYKVTWLHNVSIPEEN